MNSAPREKPVAEDMLLARIESRFCKVLAYTEKRFHALLQNIGVGDDTGDSTIIFLKDELEVAQERIDAWLTLQLDDGSWGDVQYFTSGESTFPPVEHLRRIRCMARCAHGKKWVSAAKKALGFWLDSNLRSPNWWWNEIGIPLQLGAILILMRGEMADRDVKRVVEALRICKIEDSGQNLVWRAICVMMRAVAERNFTDARLAREALDAEFGIGRAGVGIQFDWSYHYHGTQPQFGNYGLSYALTMSSLALVLKGTEWAFTEEQLGVLERFVVMGLGPVVWRDRMDIAFVGRQLNPDAARLKGVAVAAAKEYLCLASGRLCDDSASNGLTWFEKSACGVYRSKRWMASVKCCTSAVVGVECVNEDNVLGSHMADGALYMNATGREYDNIFPLWNWKHVPGTTTYDSETESASGGNELDELAVDGQTVKFSMRRSGLSSDVNMHFSREGVEVFVTGICSSRAMAVVTTVEQCHACPNAACGVVDGKLVAVNGEFVYELPKEAVVHVQRRRGSWNSHMKAQGHACVEGDVFEILVYHGMSPQAASCKWIVSHVSAVGKLPRLRRCHVETVGADASQMRILMLSREMGNPYVESLADALRRQGHTVDVDYRLFWTAQGKYDVVHMHWPRALFDWKTNSISEDDVARVKTQIEAIKICGAVFCYTRHNLLPHACTNIAAIRLSREVENLADLVIHMGKWSLAEFSGRGAMNAVKSAVIPHHIYDWYDRDMDKAAARAKLGLGEKDAVVLSFGAFRANEERELLCSACLGVNEPRLKLLAPRLFYVRDRELDQEQKRLLRDLSPIMSEDGRPCAQVSEEMLPFYFAAADVVFIQRVHILNSGNLPMAFYFGKVVVGPNVGNVGEILRQTGNPVFDSAIDGDPARALADGFRLAGRGKGAENRKYADEEWGRDRVCSALVNAYRNTLKLARTSVSKQAVLEFVSKLNLSRPSIHSTNNASVRDKLTKILQSRDEANNTVVTMREARDEAQKQVVAMREARDGALAELAKMRAARDEAQKQVVAMRNGRDGAFAELARMREARDEAQRQVVAMRDGRDGVLAELAGMREARDEAQKQVVAMRDGRDGALAELAKMREARDEAQKQVVAMREARDGAQRQLAKMRDARDEAAKKVVAMREARDSALSRAKSAGETSAMLKRTNQRLNARVRHFEDVERRLNAVLNMGGE